MDNAVGPPLVAIGDNCIDLYLQTGEQLVGGNAVNVAAQWALAGRGSAYIGAVGDDDPGRAVAAALASAGVDLQGLRTLRGHTGVTEVQLRDDGDRVILSEDLGVSADLRLGETEVQGLAGSEWVHCATLPGFREVARLLDGHHVPVSVDFSTRHEFEQLDHLEVAFFSCGGDEPDAARERMSRAVAAGARIAIATLGAGGSVARWSSTSGHSPGTAFVPAVDVTVVDTLGAGDSYAAAFIAACLSGDTVPEAMQAGAAAAATTCGHRGGWPQLSALNVEPGT
jgi:fructoselysine 6-kinase